MNGQVEQTLLCCLLTSREALDTVCNRLCPEMFEAEENRLVFGIIRDMYLAGKEPDEVSVENEMEKVDAELCHRVNGLSFLLPAMLHVRHEGNVELYAEEVERAYFLRRLGNCFSKLAFQSSDQSADPQAVWEKAQQELVSLREGMQLGSPVVVLSELARQAVEWHRKRKMGEGREAQIASGLQELDYVTGGFHKSELTILAGRPSDGKTAVALQLALNIARSGRNVCFFSLEMSSLQLLNRVLVGISGVDPDNLRVGLPRETELDALQAAAQSLEGVPFYLDYTAGASVESIRAKAMLLARQGHCDFIVVDYLHLLGGERRKGDTLEQFVARNVSALKRLALDLDCPVLVLSQMNRACETRTERAHLPVMSDLRDSGTIEQVADCVMFVYRPSRYGIERDEKTGADLRGVAKLYVLKNRNGATGIARFRYNPSFTRITDYTADTQTSLLFN